MTDDRLAIRSRGLGAPPERGDVRGERFDQGALGVSELRRLFPKTTIASFLDSPLVADGLLPPLFQATGYQPILRLDGVILAGRPLRLIFRSLQALIPMPGQTVALLLDVLPSRQAQLQRRWLQGTQHLSAYEVVNSPPRQAGAGRCVAAPPVLITSVTMSTRGTGVGNLHTAAAVPTHKQAAEQRRPVARSAQGFPMCPVLLEASHDL